MSSMPHSTIYVYQTQVWYQASGSKNIVEHKEITNKKQIMKSEKGKKEIVLKYNLKLIRVGPANKENEQFEGIRNSSFLKNKS